MLLVANNTLWSPVLEVTLEGGEQWNELYTAEVPVTLNTNFNVSMDYDAPFKSTWADGDTIGTFFRPNSGTPDHAKYCA